MTPEEEYIIKNPLSRNAPCNYAWHEACLILDKDEMEKELRRLLTQNA